MKIQRDWLGGTHVYDTADPGAAVDLYEMAGDTDTMRRWVAAMKASPTKSILINEGAEPVFIERWRLLEDEDMREYEIRYRLVEVRRMIVRAESESAARQCYIDGVHDLDESVEVISTTQLEVTAR